MNIDIMLAVLTQAGNYISLVGSYLSQTAAQIQAQIDSDPLMAEMAISYNILGSQLTTIGAAIYCILGQIAITQVIAQVNNSLLDSNNNGNDGENSTEVSEAETGLNKRMFSSSRIWHVKKVKKIQRRRWRTTQHLKINNPETIDLSTIATPFD